MAHPLLPQPSPLGPRLQLIQCVQGGLPVRGSSDGLIHADDAQSPRPQLESGSVACSQGVDAHLMLTFATRRAPAARSVCAVQPAIAQSTMAKARNEEGGTRGVFMIDHLQPGGHILHPTGRNCNLSNETLRQPAALQGLRL